MGRCADFVLRETDAKVISAFISAPEEQRIERKMRQENLSHQKAKHMVHKMDTQRRKYYEHYTQREWGKADNYDLWLDCGRLSTEEAAEQIAALYEKL